MLQQLQSAAIITDTATPGDQLKWPAFKTQSQTVLGEFQLFSSLRTSFPRHPWSSPSTLAFLFDLGEPVPTYRWNLKLRSSSLVVTENHRAFTVRAGFQLQHHGHFSLGIKAFWVSFGRPLVSGFSRLPLPHSSLSDPASREWSLSHPPTSLGMLHWAWALWIWRNQWEKVISVQMYILYS